MLNKIDYQTIHIDTISIQLETKQISTYLKNIGYFTNTIHKIEKNNKNYTVFFNLNDKIEKATIKIDDTSKIYLEKIEIKNGTFSIPIGKLQNTLTSISTRLDTEGKSFSKVQLKNIRINNKTLFADLSISPSKKRTINKVIIKGYENFPTSYLKNYFNIKPNLLFSQQKIKEISKATNSLPFVSEIKPSEVLFTKDTTLLYMYLKKQQNNSFDGIVNFASKENGDVLFNGNIDLKLNNILNTGESFELFWNSIGEEKQEFKVSTEIPYIFNTKFSPQISFSIYKQDSTFLNTKFDSKVFYNINTKAKLGFTYNSESSENLKENINNNINSFSNYFVGLQFEYRNPKNDFFFNDDFYLKINPSLGKRKITFNSTHQFKIEATVSYIYDLDARNSIYIKNKTGYLNSDSFIDNELFRIGGANSIRGFNEQSIFTTNYTYFNLEYRLLTSEKSYLYTITDLGNLKINSKTEKIIGIGIGYLFNIKNSYIKLSTAIGKKSSQNFNFKESKLIISWKNNF